MALKLGSFFDRERGDGAENIIINDVFNESVKRIDKTALEEINNKYFVGCRLDAVRTFLAKWVASQDTFSNHMILSQVATLRSSSTMTVNVSMKLKAMLKVT